MVSSEFDHKRRRPSVAELGGTDRAMIPVIGHPPTQRESQLDHHRRQHPSEQAKPSLSLADVVEEGGFHGFDPVDIGGPNEHCRRVAVCLVSWGLIKKEPDLCIGKDGPYGKRLGIIERPGSEIVEEPGSQVAVRTGHPQREAVLHSMQRMDSGRASSLAEGIFFPQLAHMPYLPASIRARAASTSSS